MGSYDWDPKKIKYFIVSNSEYEQCVPNSSSIRFSKFSRLDDAGRNLDEDIWYLDKVVRTINGSSNLMEVIFTKEYEDVGKLYGRLSQTDTQSYSLDGVVFIFLTFLGDNIDGEESLRIGGNSVKVSEIVDKVREDKTWNGKPKLFIIQADDISLMPQDTNKKGKPLPPRELKTIPFDADCFILKSTIPQKWATELPMAGERGPSFLIKAFCDEILDKNEETLDLLALTPNINRRVKEEMIKKCRERLDDNSFKKNILDKLNYPVCTSTLRKKLFFRPISIEGSGDG